MKNEDEWEQENLKNSNVSFQTKTYINDNEDKDFSVEQLKKRTFSPWRRNTVSSEYAVPRIVGIIVAVVIGYTGILSDVNLNIQIFWYVFISLVLSSIILYILRCI